MKSGKEVAGFVFGTAMILAIVGFVTSLIIFPQQTVLAIIGLSLFFFLYIFYRIGRDIGELLWEEWEEHEKKRR